MTSEKRIAANRRNALQSTGPKTPQGKELAKMNALKHGLLSREVLIAGEQAGDLEELGRKLRLQLRPIGELEQILVDRIVASVWRLRRTLHAESAVMEQQAEDAYNPEYGTGRLAKARRERRRAGAWMTRDANEKLLRYESVIERQFYRAIRELERVQSWDPGGREPRAVVVEGEVCEPPALPATETVQEDSPEMGSFGANAGETEIGAPTGEKGPEE